MGYLAPYCLAVAMDVLQGFAKNEVQGHVLKHFSPSSIGLVDPVNPFLSVMTVISSLLVKLIVVSMIYLEN